MSLELIKLNQFACSERGVFVPKENQQQSFNYSDGETIELALKNILESAADLSSASYELKSKIVDWPTEYHLSPVRSNLLRALDLSKVAKVLEMGCGCGSITRYLGEQDGIEVDAVEGSLARAELAALRCADQENVSICAANINQIDFPEDYYDLVLFVGVTEYAGRFSDAPTDQQALQELLAIAKTAIKPNGVVLVAIENRTGMKYVMGAHEDHYAMPYVGLHDYLDLNGIRTYTKKQWQQQIAQAEFSHHEFIYPFPDYKMPTVFLRENYIANNPNSFTHLEKQESRDYTAEFSIRPSELLLWESAAVSGTFGDYANSFLMLMGDSSQQIESMAAYDFVHLPDFSKKLEYCEATYKIKNNSNVYRKSVTDKTKQHSHQSEYHAGLTLSVSWLQILSSFKDKQRFEQQLRQYYQFLQHVAELSVQMTPDKLFIPDQLAMADDVQFITITSGFDESNDHLSPQSVYLRGMLKFYGLHSGLIAQHDAFSDDLSTLHDWVNYVFSVVGLESKDEQVEALLNEQEDHLRTTQCDYQSIDLDLKLDTRLNVRLDTDSVLLQKQSLKKDISADSTTKVKPYTPPTLWQSLTNMHTWIHKTALLRNRLRDIIRKSR